MNSDIYIYIRVYIYVYVYVYMYIYMYIYVYIYVYAFPIPPICCSMIFPWENNSIDVPGSPPSRKNPHRSRGTEMPWIALNS